MLLPRCINLVLHNQWSFGWEDTRHCTHAGYEMSNPESLKQKVLLWTLIFLTQTMKKKNRKGERKLKGRNTIEGWVGESKLIQAHATMNRKGKRFRNCIKVHHSRTINLLSPSFTKQGIEIWHKIIPNPNYQRERKQFRIEIQKVFTWMSTDWQRKTSHECLVS